MALESVIKEILANAEARAAAIRSERDTAIKDISGKADAEIARLTAEQDKKTAQAKEMLERETDSSAELESRMAILSRQDKILKETFDTVLENLEGAPEEKKLEYYKAMVKRAKGVIDDPKAIMSDKDNFTAKQLGVSSVEKDPSIRSGLILQSKDGTEEVDMRYSTILREIWDGNLKHITDTLFG